MSLSSSLLQHANIRNYIATAKAQARKSFAKGLLLTSMLTSMQAGGFIPDNHLSLIHI